MKKVYCKKCKTPFDMPDNFLGSGTTAIACKKLGFNFIGIEKEKDYCEIAEARLKSIPQKLF